MKKRILTALLTLALLPYGTSYAEDGYFQSELGVIEGLLAECDASGIDTPYEDLGYNVLKRFSKYIKEDEALGRDTSYNKEYMENLYSQTVENLNAYLNGKKPLQVNPYDMSEFDNFESNGRSVYSIGYGHGIQVRTDIENMNDFGATNIQMETGAELVFTELPSFNPVLSEDTVSYTIENSSKQGNYISVKNSGDTGYFRIMQNVNVEPNTTYTFGFDTKASIGDADIVSRISDTSNILQGSEVVPFSWKTHTFTYTTGDEENMVTFSLSVRRKISTMYFDNLYFKDEQGNNLLFNGDFEDDYDKKEIDNVRRDIERAYDNNTTVCLLLSPHKFPLNLDVEGMYHTEGKNGFIEFNIDLPEAKEIIERYLRLLLDEVKDCKAISSICLSNEPIFITWLWYDYYAPKFCEWLKGEYSDIKTLNEAYGTEYNDFSEVEMPSRWTSTPIFNDWVRFNDDFFLSWHEWMADIVKEYFPHTPLHTKTIRTISTTIPHGVLSYPKPEVFDAFSDWAGNDCTSFFNQNGEHLDYSNDAFLMKMLWYDFLYSITGKPVYNSEDHIVQDKHSDFDEKYARHSRADLWQGMMHHNKMSTVWVWSRTNDENAPQWNSVLYRPDCIYEIGRTALDVNRLSGEIDTMTAKKPKVAIFYSQSSRGYAQWDVPMHCDRLLEIYTQLVTLGQSVGFVMETDVSKLSEYDILVAGGAVHTTNEAADAIKNFISNGGTVISVGENFKKNQYNKITDFGINGMIPANSDNLRSILKEELEERNLLRVKLIDKSTGNMVEDVDWSFVADENDVLVNLLSLDGEKDISVYLDGRELTDMTEVIEGKDFSGVVREYVPVLLRSSKTKISEKVNILSVDNKKVRWTSNDEAYKGANIYRIKNNKLELIESTESFEYTATENDNMLIIKAFDFVGNESEGIAVCIEQMLNAYLSDGRAYVKNNTNKVQAGVLSVSLKNENGKVLKRSQVSYVLNPNQIQSMKIGFTASEGEEVIVEILKTING